MDSFEDIDGNSGTIHSLQMLCIEAIAERIEIAYNFLPSADEHDVSEDTHPQLIEENTTIMPNWQSISLPDLARGLLIKSLIQRRCFNDSMLSVSCPDQQLIRLFNIIIDQGNRPEDWFVNIQLLPQTASDRVELDLSDSKTCLTDNSLNHIINTCGHILTHLDLSRCSGFTSQNLISFFEKTPSLVDIRLCKCSGVNDSLLYAIGKNCQSLMAIDISKNPWVSDQGVLALALLLPKEALIEFRANQCNLGDPSLVILLNNHTNLHTFEINRTNAGDLTIKALVDAYKKRTQVTINQSNFQQHQINQLHCLGIAKTMISPQGLNYICPELLENLQYLDLNSCSTINQESMCNTLSHCKNLSVLFLSNVKTLTDKVICEALAPNAGNNLRNLYLTGCKLLTEKSWFSLADHCPNLSVLNISCPNFDDKCMERILSSCKNLSGLYTSGCHRLTELGIYWIAKYGRQLKALHLYGLRAVNDRTLTNMAWMLSQSPMDLEPEHEVGSSHEIEDPGTQSGLSFEPTPRSSEFNFPLTHLDISFTNILNNGIRALSSRYSFLQSLSVCTNALRHPAYEMISVGFPVLKTLNVGSCGIDSMGILYIFRNMKSLQLFNLTACAPLSDWDEKYANFAGSHTSPNQFVLPCLQVLSLGIAVRNSSVKSMVSWSPKLQHLMIAGAIEIGESSLLQLGQSCPNLQHLDAGGCTAITDNVLMNLAKYSKHLSSLVVGNCNDVSDKSICRLLQNPRSVLEILILTHCPNVTSKILPYVKNLPGLRELAISNTSISLQQAQELQTNLPYLTVRMSGLKAPERH